MDEVLKQRIYLAQSGDKKVMGELIEENNGLIWNIVKRFSSRGYELEDIYQIGAMGFIKAIQKFDFTYDVKLSTFAVPYILGEIKRFFRDDGLVKVSRGIKEIACQIRAIEEKEKRSGRQITIDEIAKRLNIEKEDVVIAMESMLPVHSVEEKTKQDDDGISILDKISDKKNEEEMLVNHLDLKNAIEELSETERQIILLRYYKGQTQSKVAKILSTSQVQISRAEKKILNIMKNKLAANQ